MKIFVVYTVRDVFVTPNFLKSVYDGLRVFSDCYVDLLHNDSVDKQARVETEILSSDIVIVLETKSVWSSGWVNREVELAVSNGIYIFNVPVSKNDSAQLVVERVFGIMKRSGFFCNGVCGIRRRIQSCVAAQ